MVQRRVQLLLQRPVKPGGEQPANQELQPREFQVSRETPTPDTADHPGAAPGTEVHLRVRTAHGEVTFRFCNKKKGKGESNAPSQQLG